MFSRHQEVTCWIDPEARVLAVGCSGTSTADLIATLLVRTLDGFNLAPVATKHSAGSQIATWLEQGEAPAPFELGRTCRLWHDREQLQYKAYPLDGEDVRDYSRRGFIPDALALAIPDRVSFTLTASGAFRGVDLMTGEKEEDEGGLWLWVDQTRYLFLQVVEALGGEA